MRSDPCRRMCGSTVLWFDRVEGSQLGGPLNSQANKLSFINLLTHSFFLTHYNAMWNELSLNYKYIIIIKLHINMLNLPSMYLFCDTLK